MLLRRSFRPEFLNRLDETVFFKPLSKNDVRAIVDLQLADLAKRLSDRQLSLQVSDTAKDFIIDAAYDPIYGARPLKRYIQSQIETLAARVIIADDPAPGTVIDIGVDDKTDKQLCIKTIPSA